MISKRGLTLDERLLAADERDLAARLREALHTGRPLPPPRVAPTLSYGRHRGPSRPSSRVAAVAVAMYCDPSGEWIVPLTRRPHHLQHHGGQICLPGGRVEPGETTREAALREFEEELGIRPTVLYDCGELSPQYVYASDNIVHPVVTVMQPPEIPWRPDPNEVEQVIALPLTRLLESEPSQDPFFIRREVRQGKIATGDLVFRASAIKYQQYCVWGATAMILDQLAQILQHECRT